MQLSWNSWGYKYDNNDSIIVGTINCAGNEANLDRCHQSNELLKNLSDCTYKSNLDIQAVVACVGKSDK